jgi:hypothetical protein
VVGVQSDGTLDILDIRTRRTASRRFSALATLLQTSPDDVFLTGQPLVSTHPLGVVLVRPYQGRALSGFSCEP